MSVYRHVVISALLVSISSGLPAWGMAPASSAPLLLWEPLSGPIEPDYVTKAREPWIRSEQPIRFVPAVLSALRDQTNSLPERIVLRLPDRHDLDMAIISRSFGALGATIIRARATYDPDGEMTLTIKGETVSGIVRIGRQAWRIEHRSDGRHRVVEFDPEQLHPD